MPHAFADVVFPRQLTKPLTYRIPPQLQDTLALGDWVVVPLGRTTRMGFVIALYDTWPTDGTSADPDRLREITRIVDNSSYLPLSPELVALAQQIAEYYVAPLGPCLRLIQPPAARMAPPVRLRITSHGRDALERQRLSPRIATLLSRLAQATPNGLSLASCKRSGSSQALARLRQKGWIEEVWDEASSHPLQHRRPRRLSDSFTSTPSPFREAVQHPSERQEGWNLSLPQSESSKSSIRFPPWWDHFCRLLFDHAFHQYFLPGASVDILPWLEQAVDMVLSQRRATLILTPNIPLAIQLMAWAAHHWPTRTILYHGQLRQAERARAWQQSRHPPDQVIIGTRAALFLPVQRLGLIWLVNEEDTAYQEEQCPYYHTRDVARMRAQQEQAILLLSSAHPSLETYARFSQQGNTLTLPAHPPKSVSIHVVNMQTIPFGSPFSQELINGLHATIQAGGQAILYLNRTGFSRALVCRDCGHAPQCPRCHISLILYKQRRMLSCGYCGETAAPPQVCPTCASPWLDPIGFGTERVEEEVKRLFPGVSVGRCDRTTMTHTAAASSLLEQFRKQDLQVLIGTQQLLSAGEIKPVAFVGLPFAEAGLHRPDFRAAELVYHHLSQATALAAENGTIILQTYLPEHHAIRAIATARPETFYDQELTLRQALGYPPFSHFLHLWTVGTREDLVQRCAQYWAQLLATQLTALCAGKPDPLLLGPIAPMPLRTRKLQARKLIVVKTAHLESTRQAIRTTLTAVQQQYPVSQVQFIIQVDPLIPW
ncbi:MAG: primosomal protein N' [Nitrospirae bacterium]|nr:MAG: primosomal protein N' [Nitrospirota bacterium]